MGSGGQRPPVKMEFHFCVGLCYLALLGMFFNFDSGIFQVWDPSKQLRAEVSLNMLKEFLNVVEYDVES